MGSGHRSRKYYVGVPPQPGRVGAWVVRMMGGDTCVALAWGYHHKIPPRVGAWVVRMMGGGACAALAGGTIQCKTPLGYNVQ
jgi:hypothetical protein